MKMKLAAMAILALATGIRATPVYYQFSGRIVWYEDDRWNRYDKVGDPFVGETVEYTFMVNRDQQAKYLQDGVTYLLPYFEPGPEPRDQFYVEYIGGSAIPTDVPNQQVAYYLGNNRYTMGGLESSLIGSNFDFSGNDYISIDAYGRTFEQWEVGQSDFHGGNVIFGTGGGVWVSQLTLTGISNNNPLEVQTVPEPNPEFMVGSVLLLLIGMRRVGKRRLSVPTK